MWYTGDTDMGHLISALIMVICLAGVVGLVIKTIDQAFAKRVELRAFRAYQEAKQRGDDKGIRRALREAEKALRRQH